MIWLGVLGAIFYALCLLGTLMRIAKALEEK